MAAIRGKAFSPKEDLIIIEAITASLEEGNTLKLGAEVAASQIRRTVDSICTRWHAHLRPEKRKQTAAPEQEAQVVGFVRSEEIKMTPIRTMSGMSADGIHTYIKGLEDKVAEQTKLIAEQAARIADLEEKEAEFNVMVGIIEKRRSAGPAFRMERNGNLEQIRRGDEA